MQAVFAEAYVPAGMRADFLKRCAGQTGELGASVWTKCLLELLYVASTSSATIPTGALVRACETCTETLASGLDVKKKSDKIRKPSIEVAAKICAWHFDRPELVTWLVDLLKSVAMLDRGRMPVDLARRLCENAVTYQGLLRSDDDSDALGMLLLRLCSLGPYGGTTLRKLWNDRDEHLGYAIQYRAWKLLEGLAATTPSLYSEDGPRVAVQFDCDLWLCAAAERLNDARRNILKDLLRHFRHAVLRKKIQCSPYKCLAMTMIEAAMRPRRREGLEEPEPSLIGGVKLFLDYEHAVSGCKHSVWRSVNADDRRSEYCRLTLPAWGGVDSSCAATVARRCIEINTARNASNGPDGICGNPTESIVELTTPLLLKAIENDDLGLAKSLFAGVVAQHTRQAIAVLAAAPFLNGSERSRLQLVDGLQGRTKLWRQCIQRIPMCGERIMSRLHAWKPRDTVYNLFEAASAARAFQCDDGQAFRTALKLRRHNSHEASRLWAISCALSMLSLPTISSGLAELHALASNMDLEEPDTMQLHVMDVVLVLQEALEHPEFSRFALEGRYTGHWHLPRAVSDPEDLMAFAARIKSPELTNVLRREAGLWQIRPCDGHKGWWHLGAGFARAARCFMGLMDGYRNCTFTLPSEIAIIILGLAARL